MIVFSLVPRPFIGEQPGYEGRFQGYYSSCTLPRTFLLAFLKTNPCLTLYPTLVSETILMGQGIVCSLADPSEGGTVWVQAREGSGTLNHWRVVKQHSCPAILQKTLAHTCILVFNRYTPISCGGLRRRPERLAYGTTVEFPNYVCPQLQWPKIFFATIILCTVFPRVVKESTALHVQFI